MVVGIGCSCRGAGGFGCGPAGSAGGDSSGWCQQVLLPAGVGVLVPAGVVVADHFWGGS